ncbi:MAG: glycosyl hydrolase family 18 protein [Bacteroidota bacterium]|nr:glycosyl hydrolase family 18 protein [Bacteroidota bacterium]
MNKKTSILLVLGFVFLMKASFAQPCKEVIAYYPNWQWYDRSHLVEPTSIDYSKYSIINYAFFNPLADGSIAQTDSWADENLLFGQPDWVNGGYLPNTSLIDIAHNNNVDVMVSIGGWTLSNNFPGIAANQAKRTYFASECIRLLQTFGFDGIDLDWEYPGYAEHNGTAADGVNFTLLVQEIRDSIDAYGLSVGKNFLLSSCFSADPAKMEIIEWSNLIGELDMFNIMTYDFFGAFSAVSNHNSPLYTPAVGTTSFNIDSAFINITQTHGVPSSFVNIGVPFYGRSVTNCTGLHQSHSGAGDAATFWEDEGTPLFYNVLKNMNLFTTYWDSQAQVPYLLGNSINTFVSYDDEQSVALKAEYVVNNNARGVIVWELTGDYVETSQGSGTIDGTPLIDTLNAVLCSIPTSIEEDISVKNKSLSVIPNPVRQNRNIAINISDKDFTNGTIEVFSVEGKIIYSSMFNNQTKFSFSFSDKGLYIIKISNNVKIYSQKMIVY